MTFYNVISGILFLGAVQAFLHELGKPGMAYAATLAAIIFNEAVSTSELLEGPAALTYSLRMKLTDLLTFLILSYALIVLSPNGNTFTDKDLTASVWGAGRPGVFLILLALYDVVALYWTQIAGRNVPTIWKHPILLLVARLFWVPFVVFGAIYWGSQSFDTISPIPGILLCSFVIAYLVAKVPMLKEATVEPVCRFRP